MITVEQNTPKQIQRLGAQRQLYATAKTIFIAQIILCGPVAIASVYLAKVFPASKASVALWGFIVLLSNMFWLTPWLEKRRTEAARVQEAFDCDVLDLPWNDIKVGDRPDPELIKEQSDKYNNWAARMPILQNWYAPSVANLPLHIGRIVCQRSNCSWDGRLRRRYAAFIIAALALLCLIILVLSFERNYTLQDFLLKVILPLAPALGLGYKQFIEQRNAASRLDDLKTHCYRVWDDALSGEEERVITKWSRDLQDEIFESRRKSPLVFDAVFKWLRKTFQDQMKYAADDLVTEAENRITLLQKSPNVR